MKRVAVFGNTGGGKSTLARTLAALTGLPLYPLDLVQWRVGGEALLVGQASRGVARGKPRSQEHPQLLPRAVALSPAADAQI